MSDERKTPERNPVESKSGFAFLDWVERVGNKLPDPVTLFVIGCLAVVIGSEIAFSTGWQLPNPAQKDPAGNPVMITATSMLRPDGMRMGWTKLVENFTKFPPLGIVLVGLLGIGVAERSGLVGSLLRAVVLLMPRSLLAPAVVFAGAQSSMASDAGYIVLPPLAALVFMKAGRAPSAGLAAAFAGVAGGFSANLLITSLDPLLVGFTDTAAKLLNPNYDVAVTCNYFFMVASTFLITAVGWFVNWKWVEPRFSQADVHEQTKTFGAHLASGGSQSDELTSREQLGLLAAGVATLVGVGILAAMVLIEGAPLYGNIQVRPDSQAMEPVWVKVIVPIILFLALIAGLAYGITVGTITSDRKVAKMMSETMAQMGAYIVMAFFAAQFVSWFNDTNLGKLMALQGVRWLQAMNMPWWMLLTALILFTMVLNLFIGSASAKWGLMATVVVPVLMGVGISPELTQAAYRVGDSVTNIITPLNPYAVIVLVYLQNIQNKAGVGSLISLMLPYAFSLAVVWLVFILIWVSLGIPLGPKQNGAYKPLFIEPPSLSAPANP